MKFILPATVAFLAILSPTIAASPLKNATVSRLVNEVETVAPQGQHRRAAEQEILADDTGLRVGPHSRAEFIFADRTLARLGGETFLKLQPGTREMSLDRGTLLLQVPKFRGSVHIRTGALTIVCGGATILVEHLPGKSLKAVVLEGEMRVSVARFLGDSIVVSAGKMLIASPDTTRLPDPVDTDLRTLASTSALIVCGPANASVFSPLPSVAQIVREIARQEDALKTKRLVRTNLTIFGSGTNVVIPTAVSPAEAAVNRNLEKENRSAAKATAPLVAVRPPESGAVQP